MSKLSLFFDKKKKKSLKTSLNSEKEGESKNRFFGEPDNVVEDEWAVQAEDPNPDEKNSSLQEGLGETSPKDSSEGAHWLKVSAVDAVLTNKYEEKNVWGSKEAEEGDKGEEEKDDENSEEQKEESLQKWISPSLRKRQQQKANVLVSADDPTLSASVAATASKKASPIAEQKEKKDKKPKEKEKKAENEVTNTKFNVWNFVELNLGSIGGINATQDDEASLKKYIERGPRSKLTAIPAA